MINTIKIEDRPYTVYNNITNRSIKLASLAALKLWVAKEIDRRLILYRGDKNFLKDINMTFNDTIYDLDGGYRLRKYTILDSLNRVVDIRVYAKEIEELATSRKYVVRKDRLEHIRFRVDPIPGISKVRGYRWYRSFPHTMNEKRKNSDPSIKEFIRGCRTVGNLKDSRDDINICIDSSWKTSRIKKQYMKHWKHNRTKVTSLREINKRNIYTEYDEEDIMAA